MWLPAEQAQLNPDPLFRSLKRLRLWRLLCEHPSDRFLNPVLQ